MKVTKSGVGVWGERGNNEFVCVYIYNQTLLMGYQHNLKFNPTPAAPGKKVAQTEEWEEPLKPLHPVGTQQHCQGTCPRRPGEFWWLLEMGMN